MPVSLQDEKDPLHFYLAVRSFVFKLTKGSAPDTALMNVRVREMIAETIKSKEEDAFTTEVHEEAIEAMFGLMGDLKTELASFEELGISMEEKAFYDILKKIADKYQFTYEEDRLLALATKVKAVVDDKTRFPDWNNRGDIKASLRVELIMLLSKHGYPPVSFNEVYQDVFEQRSILRRGGWSD